jgi:putative transposase
VVSLRPFLTSCPRPEPFGVRARSPAIWRLGTPGKRFYPTCQLKQRLKQIAQQVADETRCQISEMEADGDHFHMLVECDPQFGIHRLIKAIKGRSSRLLRQEFQPLRTRVPTLWTNSYFVATVGGAPLAVVKRYIQDQKCS